MAGLYYEQFHEGQVFEHQVRRTVTEMDNILFSAMTMSTQPLHMDFEFCKTTRWGKPLVHSIFTLGLIMGIAVHDTTFGTTMGNLGMSHVSFPNPVFHGDTIRSVTEVKSMRRSKSIPDAGIIELEHRGYNQEGTLVAVCVRAALMSCLPEHLRSKEQTA